MSRICYATTGDMYFNNQIHSLVQVNHYESDENREWIFYHKVGSPLPLVLPLPVLKTMYIKSGCVRDHREYACIGVYESRKRLRVLPFIVAESPRGEEVVVAFKEIISGRHYALPLKDFKSNFKLDILYNGQVDIMGLSPSNQTFELSS